METPDDRASDSAADAFKQLASDLTMLARDQLEAARQEMAEKVRLIGVGAGILSASAVALIFTAACLTAFAMVGLAVILPAWLAVLIVTLVWGAVAAALAIIGRRKVKEAGPLTPEQTIEDLRQDLKWAKRHRRSGGL